VNLARSGTIWAAPFAIPDERRRRGRAQTGATVDQRDLVERARRGDHDAFATLVRAVLVRLDAAARLILRDRDLAQDAVQEAMLRACPDLPGLRDPDKFEPWVRRLTVHACIDLARKRRRRTMEVELDPLDLPPVADATPALLQRDLVDRALSVLEPEWRAIVVLHFYLGLPLHEVAGALGIPVGTAKSRLHRSLAVLRESVGTSRGEALAALREGQTA
jgi:RNA polymerase sigma-70 factor (ECF subfamily)